MYSMYSMYSMIQWINLIKISNIYLNYFIKLQIFTNKTKTKKYFIKKNIPFLFLFSKVYI